MFQRLKGALDSIADEQLFQSASSTPASRSSRPPSSRRQLNPPKSRQQSNDALQKVPFPEGPDPDPAQFNPETIVAENDAPKTIEGSEPLASTGHNEEAGLDRGAPGTGAPASEADAAYSSNPPTVPAPQVLSADVNLRLKKLDRLEIKYNELLRAYKKAHARNSAIEPFEAQLRENTPLTTIGDPAAFVEYLKELNAKNEMALDELKRISNERDSLKQRLEKAEQRSSEGLNESSEARSHEFTTSPARNDARRESLASKDAQSEEIPLQHARQTLEQASPSIIDQQPSDHEAAMEDIFSIDDELPRLQAALQDRDEKIVQFEHENEDLRRNLSVARESAEQMMRDLEVAQQNVAGQKELQQQYDEQKLLTEKLETKLGENERAISDLETKLATKTAEQQTTNTLRDVHGGGGVEHLDGERGDEIAEASGTPAVDVAGEDDAEKAENLAERNAAVVEQLRNSLLAGEELAEEVESLKEDLLNIGQEHVDAKELLKEVQNERESLRKQVIQLEYELAAFSTVNSHENTTPTSSTDDVKHEEFKPIKQLEISEAERARLEEKVRQLEQEIQEHKKNHGASEATSEEAHSKLSTDFDDLQAKSRSLQTDLAAAQQLAASRFRELTNVRDALQKAQPELASLRTEVADLKGAKELLVTKNRELRKLESREEGLRAEVDAYRKDLLTKDGEIKTLHQRVSQETSQRLSSEESSRRANRELQRVQNEKSEALSTKESTTRERDELRKELAQSRGKLRELEDKAASLARDTESLRDDISLKTAQHASAQSLMSSVRDQAAEMATQLKEARDHAESLEEELTDAHRLMSERGREGETMRRLLNEIEGRAEARVKEMRERMETALQERDRAEDEASAVGRRKTRELEDLKNKIRELEREMKNLAEENADVRRAEGQLKKLKELESRRAEESLQEVEELKKAMAELRDTLDEGERQTKALEAEKREARRSAEEIQQRLDKLQKSNKNMVDELRSLRATRMRPIDGGAQSARSSTESLPQGRMLSPEPGGKASSRSSIGASNGASSGGTVDFVYLKNVLLQFLEQKDKAYQMQLVPVLSMLLHFDKREEQKWMSVINAR